MYYKALYFKFSVVVDCLAIQTSSLLKRRAVFVEYARIVKQANNGDNGLYLIGTAICGSDDNLSRTGSKT